MAPLVEIPGETSVSQLVGSTDTPIGTGALSLHDGSSAGGLIVRVGNAAFDVPASTAFYTHADDPLIYLFDAPVDAGANNSYIKLRLPSNSTSRFEEVLIERKFLKDGPAATVDELGRSVREDAHFTAIDLGNRADEHVSSAPGTSQPAQFSETTKSIVDVARSATGTAAEYTSWAAGAIASATSTIGAKITEAVDPAQHGYEKSETRKSLESAAAQIGESASTAGQGISEVTSQAVDSVRRVVQHDHGDEAAELASEAGQTTRNVGTIAGDAIATTTMGGHAAFASSGAVDALRKA